jgi:hypothetical protein
MQVGELYVRAMPLAGRELAIAGRPRPPFLQCQSMTLGIDQLRAQCSGRRDDFFQQVDRALRIFARDKRREACAKRVGLCSYRRLPHPIRIQVMPRDEEHHEHRPSER